MTGPEEPEVVPCAGGRTHEPADPIWCPGCTATISEHLAELPRLVTALEHEAADGQRGAPGGDVVTGTRGTPSPSAVVDDIDEITRLLEYWEDAHREAVEHTYRPARPHARRVGAAVAYLGEHLAVVLAAPYAVEFGRDVNRLHARARRRTAQDSARTRKPIPCPGCDLLALIHDAGSKYIACESCGRLLTFTEYDSWARLAAAGARQTARSTA